MGRNDAFNIPIVATSRYVPPGAAMNRSKPTPASANLLAVFFQAGFSVVKSFRSASVPASLGSSRIAKCPGPQVGKLATAQTIFPPVACSAESAEFNVGSKADSGFLIEEKILGIRPRREVITDLNIVSDL